jgi:hypothetical protein
MKNIPKRPIVFLDMDDVVAIDRNYTSYQVKMAFKLKDMDYPELWQNLVHPEARENLRSLHDEFWPQYVSSTSWSTFLSKEEMKETFRRTGLSFVAENLHKQWTTPKGAGSSRLQEIRDWNRLYRQKNQPVLVLDDLESGWNLKGSSLEEEGLVVLCEPWKGFTREKYLEAKMRLNQQIDGKAIEVL